MHTVPMTRRNLGQCAWITTECYGADGVFMSWIRPRHATALPNHWAHAFASRLRSFLISPDQGLRVMVSDDSDHFYSSRKDEEIIGYAAWFRERGTQKTDAADVQDRPFGWSKASRWFSLEQWLLGLEMRYDQWLDADTAYDREAFGIFIGTLKRAQAKLNEMVMAQSPERGYIYLEELHCKPEFQRNGVGKRLVQQGLDQATAENVPVCLMASDDGERLYSRMGFRTLGMAYYGKYSSPAMVWYPPGWKVAVGDHFAVDGNHAQQ